MKPAFLIPSSLLIDDFEIPKFKQASFSHLSINKSIHIIAKCSIHSVPISTGSGTQGAISHQIELNKHIRENTSMGSNNKPLQQDAGETQTLVTGCNE
jgi:hypothetical protein